MSHAAKAKIGHFPPHGAVSAKSKVNDVKHHKLHLNQHIMHQECERQALVPSQDCTTVSPPKVVYH